MQRVVVRAVIVDLPSVSIVITRKWTAMAAQLSDYRIVLIKRLATNMGKCKPHQRVAQDAENILSPPRLPLGSHGQPREVWCGARLITSGTAPCVLHVSMGGEEV